MKQEKDFKIKDFFKLIALVVSLWVISWITIDILYSSVTDRGAFGDKFGFINSLFSGLALAGIIYSIFLQQRELSLQRTELAETKEEFKDQNFQTTFFNLLKTQNQIANDISARVYYIKNYNNKTFRNLEGRDFFIQSRFELQRIDKALSNSNYLNYRKWDAQDGADEPQSYEEAERLTKMMRLSYTFEYYKIDKETWGDLLELNSIQKAEKLYAIFFNKFHFAIGHYFRHIYHILLFLEKMEKEKISKTNSITDFKDKNIEIERINAEFKQYADFLQAQMSTPELFLLFYNSLSFPKLKRLLIKYNTLENLPKEDLLNDSHDAIEGINLKSRKEILK
ncbi:putative phage abortive infection protein [Zunongwangia sp. HRR-M8]|uniref:putative phage abortive infection protein n=1 Tax=Zunongwangia sp. HRR-M8 TaxID=3015170 RepID=UPI0022DD86F9|nr:putative phage abortive infection protein [Zunongwangia sp. HRR-M8]WBL22316.1 hypothetical protein PBT89_16575 [Zunongwangia sp. HRR-M8]